MVKGMLVVNWVGGAIVSFALFFLYSDRSWLAALQWGLFYAAGLGFPYVLAQRASRIMNSHQPPISDQLRRTTLYPMWAAWVVMLAALMLVRASR